MKTQLIPIEKIRPNTGQIEGLPKNPRFIRDHKYEKLKQSIVALPSMLELREVILFPFGDIFVAIGGNMRYRACVDLEYKKVPSKVLPADTPVEVLAEIAIKDNGDFGENDWDILANEWDVFDLEAWGFDIITAPPDLDGLFVEDTTDKKHDLHTIALHYSEEEFEKVKAGLLKKAKTYEEAVKILLGL